MIRIFLLFFILFWSEFLLAGSAGGGLPWDSPLETLSESITGPVAFFVSLIGIVASLVGLVFGGDKSQILKIGTSLVLVISIIVGASSFMQSVFNVSGTTITVVK